MTPYPHDAHPPATTAVTSGETGPRLQLKPSAATTEHVDGAWWPRSASLSTELPALLEALSDRLDRVVLVGYHVSGWQEAPAQVEYDGRPVRLDEFRSDAPHTLLLIGTDGQRIALLVVAANTPQATAHRMLLTASQPAEDSAGEAKDSAARSITEVATRLAHREGAKNDQRTATIAQWVEQAAAQFTHAPIQAFVPILVEHIVRGHMA